MDGDVVGSVGQLQAPVGVIPTWIGRAVRVYFLVLLLACHQLSADLSSPADYWQYRLYYILSLSLPLNPSRPS